LKDPLAAGLKRSGIQRQFPIAVGTRSGAFPDFGSGYAGLGNVRAAEVTRDNNL
jgi:hypothetical protein